MLVAGIVALVDGSNSSSGKIVAIEEQRARAVVVIVSSLVVAMKVVVVESMIGVVANVIDRSAFSVFPKLMKALASSTVTPNAEGMLLSSIISTSRISIE